MFGPFERMLAMRYLRARRQEGFISVIAAFSLLGIGLGVATLIIVMAVMNGFRAELLGRILGLNGHMTIYSQGGQSLTVQRRWPQPSAKMRKAERALERAIARLEADARAWRHMAHRYDHLLHLLADYLDAHRHHRGHEVVTFEASGRTKDSTFGHTRETDWRVSIRQKHY